MADFFEDTEDIEKPEIVSLVKRFESMLRKNEHIFFDVYEFEDIIDFYFEKDNLNQSNLALKYAIELHPGSAPLLLRQAMYYASKNEQAKTLKILKKIDRFESQDPDFIYAKGSIFSQLKMHQKSIDEYRKLIDNWDDPAEIFINLAVEHQSLNEFEIAVDYLKKALATEPDNQSILYELGYCYEMLNQTQNAITFFNQFISEYPYSDTAWFNLAIAYSNLGLFEKSIEAYDYVIAINPELISAYFNKANALVEIERFQDAIDVFRELLIIDESDAMIYYYIGECYEKMFEWNSAIDNYNQAIAIDELIAEAWVGLGVVYEELNKPMQAMAFYEKAVELEPINSEYWYMLGDLQLKLNNISEALESYNKVSELDAKNIDIWLDISEIHFTNLDYVYAINSVIEGISYQKNNASLMYRLSVYLYYNGQIRESLLRFEQALSLDFDKHPEFFDFAPELLGDRLFNDLIDLYKTNSQ